MVKKIETLEKMKDLLFQINTNLMGEETNYDSLKIWAAAGKVRISTIQKIDWTPVEYISIRNGNVIFRYENGNETIITTLQHIAIKVVD